MNNLAQPKIYDRSEEDHFKYAPAQWDGRDTSAIRVVGKTVLILMDQCDPVSRGGVAFPSDLLERKNMQSESGILIVAAAGAFLLNEDGTPWSGEKPKPGDRVYVDKYAGKVVKGRDGKTYRLMDYGSIGAIYEPESEGV